MPLLCCIFYIETPDSSSPSVNIGVLVSRSLTLDNVEDLHIVCSVPELCTWNNYQSFLSWLNEILLITRFLKTSADYYGGKWVTSLVVGITAVICSWQIRTTQKKEKRRGWRRISQIQNENLLLVTTLLSDNLYRISFYSWLLKILNFRNRAMN